MSQTLERSCLLKKPIELSADFQRDVFNAAVSEASWVSSYGEVCQLLSKLKSDVWLLFPVDTCQAISEAVICQGMKS